MHVNMTFRNWYNQIKCLFAYSMGATQKGGRLSVWERVRGCCLQFLIVICIIGISEEPLETGMYQRQAVGGSKREWERESERERDTPCLTT